MTWSINDVLLSKKELKLNLEPFPFFQIDNFLPQDLYQAIATNWPEKTFIDQQLAEGKLNIDLTVETAKNLNPAFEFLFECVSSQQFVDDYFEVLKQGFEKACAPFPISGFSIGETVSSGIACRRVEINSQLSRLEDSAFLSPHTDKYSKFLSLLLYIPEPNWREEYGGQTVLYQANKAKHNKNWSNFHLPFEDVTEVHRSMFKANTLFGFIKTKNSWHGVSPVSVPSGIGRHSINFNYQTPARTQKSFVYRALEAFHRRRESRFFHDAPDMKSENRKMRDQRILEMAREGYPIDQLAYRFSMKPEAIEILISDAKNKRHNNE
ncbi:MAG: hypothetical protein CMM62_03755 [Rhodospirillaceae bacterium]|jgi:Rps23 Pro-64 3,4-dihydroxylase Tpa1-like proline 4-hydroxylase|nr:hypothetical protein [Rhodospirillaceae bacterium]MAX62445.1 hypothetical protein [Rhodospirillaceae bacterium]MBB56843.1 hypothetical protein [Rhodospirillaceae bacterium]|tara:strand:+ start:208 stop:1176 length:969 start_codon:yes stop_codon:yes gene_type:complete